jgi:hypothetical protein
MATGFEEMMKNGSSPDLVAKVVLNAATNENPNLRYLVGNDVEQWLGSNRNMSDGEFYKMMKQNLMMYSIVKKCKRCPCEFNGLILVTWNVTPFIGSIFIIYSS